MWKKAESISSKLGLPKQTQSCDNYFTFSVDAISFLFASSTFAEKLMLSCINS